MVLIPMLVVLKELYKLESAKINDHNRFPKVPIVAEVRANNIALNRLVFLSIFVKKWDGFKITNFKVAIKAFKSPKSSLLSHGIGEWFSFEPNGEPQIRQEGEWDCESTNVPHLLHIIKIPLL